ncbi:glutamine synthetase [Streptomyces sp. NPDC050433]|uniref:glutamine synthetase n=1 Tax=Streptomyces sp. NPDC050433 TaxID=3365615 RepID=UPI003799ED75
MSTPSAVFVATCDLAAQVRGRSAPHSAHDHILRSGTGWVPANLGLDCFGGLAPDAPFGSTGDLRLRPDPATGADLDSASPDRALRIYLADQVLPDGSDWDGCPRTFARRALRELEESYGLRLTASFEHEFVLSGAEGTAPFSLRRHRAAEPFGGAVLAALTEAGLEPETWLPEFGVDQFEITLRPAEGLRSADRAVLLREFVRDIAARHGRRITFAPMVDAGGTGSGVHVHLSLRDRADAPVMYDADAPGRLSRTGRLFASGVVRHAAALTALTAPSPASFVRLREHKWSASGAYLGIEDREALLRVCPTVSLNGTAPEEQFNVEFRAADATANPWLVLGALVRAGMAGLADPGAPPVAGDPAHAAALPATPAEALAALLDDTVARNWLPPLLLETFVAVRRSEAAQVEGLSDQELCDRIADVY